MNLYLLLRRSLNLLSWSNRCMTTSVAESSCIISQVLPKIFHKFSKIFAVTSTILLCISYVVHSEASLPNISMEDFLFLRNSSIELQILVDSLTWFEVLKNLGFINSKITLHRLDSKTLSALKLWYIA